MSNHPIKQIVFNNIKSEAQGRIRAGICAVFGNIDSYGDITHKGSFTKSLNEGARNRVKHLWNHDSNGFPTAKIHELREVDRHELPQEILDFAPDATGGLYVKREYFSDCEAILERIDSGVIDEMSFAYEVVKSDKSKVKGENVRNLRELILFDTSDVNYGANPATLGSGMKRFSHNKPIGLIYQDLLNIENQIKSGRRNSESDQKLLDLIHNHVCDLGAECSQPKSDNTNSEQKNDTETPEAEAAEQNSTSLLCLGLKIRSMEIENLTL